MPLDNVLPAFETGEEGIELDFDLEVNIAEEEPQSNVPPEAKNLAEDLDEEERTRIASKVWDDYQDDEQSRKRWMDMHSHAIDLYNLQDKPKSRPWEGSSEESIPIVTEACNQFQARTMTTFFRSQEIVRGLPVGAATREDFERANRVGKYINWQLLVKDKHYKKNKDRMVLSVALHGSAFTKTYYEPFEQRVVVENVRAADLCVPYGTGPRDLEDIERKTHIIDINVSETERYARAGYILEAALPFRKAEESGYDDAVEQKEGLDENLMSEGLTARILEQHCMLQLPTDEFAKPYIAWIDEESRKLLRIGTRYEEETDAQGNIHYKPIEYFTHYYLNINPDGFYGLGYGHSVGTLNTSINKMLRQGIDAGTLQNTNTGLVSKQLGIRKGEIETTIGKYTPVDANVDDIRKAIITLDHKGPSTALMGLMEMVIGRADRLAMVTEALTGQTDKVLQPTTIMALIEQGLQQFTAAQERLIRSWGEELQKVYKLNAKYLYEEEYFNVLDAGQNQHERMSISPDDFKVDYEIITIADPRVITEQHKQAKAEAEWNFTTQLMQIGYPMTPTNLYNAAKRRFESFDTKNIDELLPIPQDPKNKPQRVDDPIQENMMALHPGMRIAPVFPDQDHYGHVGKHMPLATDHEQWETMSKVDQDAFWEHIRVHQAFQYGQQAGASLEDPQAQQPEIDMDQVRALVGGLGDGSGQNGQGFSPTLDKASGNAVVSAGAAPQVQPGTGANSSGF